MQRGGRAGAGGARRWRTFGEAVFERLHPLDQPPRVLLARPILLGEQSGDRANITLRALKRVGRGLRHLLPLPVAEPSHELRDLLFQLL